MKESPVKHSMKIRRIISAVFFLLSGIGCAREENLFAPKSSGSVLSYNYSTILTRYDVHSGNKISLDLGVQYDSPFIVNMIPVGSWTPGSFPEEPDYDYYAEIHRWGDRSYFFFREDQISCSPITNDSISPVVDSVYVNGSIYDYGFTYTAFFATVHDPSPSVGLCFERHYKVTAVDLYGRQKTDYFSVRPMRAHLVMRDLYNPMNIRNAGVGHVVGVAGDEYTIKFTFGEHELSELSYMSYHWQVTNITVHDLGGSSVEHTVYPPMSFDIERWEDAE